MYETKALDIYTSHRRKAGRVPNRGAGREDSRKIFGGCEPLLYAPPGRIQKTQAIIIKDSIKTQRRKK